MATRQPWNDGERAALVALLRNRPARMTYSQVAAEIADHGSALSCWNTHNPGNLFDADNDDAVVAAQRDITAWRAEALGFLTFADDDYPAQLHEIHDFPPVLFHRGNLKQDDVGVSVVGSREATGRGRDIAEAIATGLVERGITVIAGLARGIDTAAHLAALEANGRTVAIIGTGIKRYYPAANRALQDRIASEGLLLSQFWPDSPPTRSSFPMRNTVMSGYGRATIVVQAGERSGARIQAGRAVAHGRPVILTDLVVNANQWAQEMRGKPGVYVASSTAEVMEIVSQISAIPAELDELLAAASHG